MTLQSGSKAKGREMLSQLRQLSRKYGDAPVTYTSGHLMSEVSSCFNRMLFVFANDLRLADTQVPAET